MWLELKEGERSKLEVLNRLTLQTTRVPLRQPVSHSRLLEPEK